MMIREGEVLDIPARDIHYGDVVILGGSGGGAAIRYVVGQPYVTDDGGEAYVRFPVGQEPDGYAVGHWQIRADVLHVVVIR
jgi:hypothetical protein